MTADVTIDLGLDRAPPEDEGPGWSFRRQWARWRRWGRALSLGLCVVAVSAFAASNAPPSPGLTLLAEFRETGGYPQISGDYLILYKEDGAVSVHRLPAGEQLWTNSGRFPRASETPGVLYGYVCGSGGTRCDEVDTIALDAATGAELWSVPGDPVPGTDGRLYVAVSSDMVAVTEDASVYHLPIWLEVRDETGAARWSVERPDGLSYFMVPGGEDDTPLIAVYDAFSLEVRDAVTGAVRSRYQAPRQERIAGANLTEHLVLLHSVVADGESTHTLMRAFDLETLTPRWERRMPVESVDIRDCGALLCAQPLRQALTTSIVLDPDTGAELWSTEGWVDSVGEHLLVWSDPFLDERPAGTPRVVAARTGGTLVDLTDWKAVGRGDEGTVVLTAPTSAGTAVAVLDPGASTPRLLGRVEMELNFCLPFDGGMACDGDDRVTLWSVAGPAAEE